MNWRDRADRLRSLPLPAVLVALQATPDPHDPLKWRTERGVLSVSGSKFINWSKSVGGGGAIDLVMHLLQVGFGQAMEWLEDHFGSVHPLQPTTTTQAQSFTLPAPVPANWPLRVRTVIDGMVRGVNEANGVGWLTKGVPDPARTPPPPWLVLWRGRK